MQSVEDIWVGGDKRRLVAIASGKVLGSNYRNHVATFGLHQQNLAVIISKISTLDNLGYK